MADTHAPPYNRNTINVCKDERRLLYACRMLLQMTKLQPDMRDLCARVLSGDAPQTVDIVKVIDHAYCGEVQQRRRGSW